MGNTMLTAWSGRGRLEQSLGPVEFLSVVLREEEKAIPGGK